MKKLALLLFVSLIAAPTAVALDRTQTQALIRIAQKASGLKARQHVRVVVDQPARFRQRRVLFLDRAHPRAGLEYDESVYRALGLADAGKGILRKTLIEMQDRRGLYDPAARTAFVQAGAGVRATALHEIVHALQDQHYDLRRLSRLRGDSDALRAASAVVEGHALLAANVLAAPRTVSRSRPTLTRFLELQRGFDYTVGLRFAAELRNLGGNKALLGALGRFPATSEQVFHLDKYLERERASPIVLPVEAAGMTLAGSDTFGELEVRALLAVFGVPRLDRAGNGWGGGRTARYRSDGGEAVLVALDWDTELDAREWAEAVTLYVDKAFDAATPGPPATSECTATSCWQIGAGAIAFDRSGSRTALVVGVDPRAAESLARLLTGRG